MSRYKNYSKKLLSYIALSKKNLLHNYFLFKKNLPKQTKIAVVVKGNAYGHGQTDIVRLLAPVLDYWQIDDIEELRLVRKISIKPAILLGYVAKADLNEVVSLGAELAIYDTYHLALLNKIGQKNKCIVKIHLKVDALLGREGMLLEDVPNFLKQLRHYHNIKLAGIYAHFSNIEDTVNLSHAHKQLTIYYQALVLLKQHGYKNILQHISATSGILTYEFNGAGNNLVRLGIGLYGLWPSLALQNKYAGKKFKLKPVLSWVTHVAQVKKLPSCHPIGYGLTYITKKPTTIALIPQGYSDGYDRKLSNNGEVLIHGKKCRVIGRISMNMFTVDISHLKNVKVEDEVVLLGKQGQAEISAEDIAAKINTINYEVVARISPLLPRVVR